MVTQTCSFPIFPSLISGSFSLKVLYLEMIFKKAKIEIITTGMDFLSKQTGHTLVLGQNKARGSKRRRNFQQTSRPRRWPEKGQRVEQGFDGGLTGENTLANIQELFPGWKRRLTLIPTFKNRVDLWSKKLYLFRLPFASWHLGKSE